MPTVQIAVSIYGQDNAHIKQCIRSALSQTLSDVVITVRTDGTRACSESSLRWLRKKSSEFSSLTLIEGVKRIGIYGSYNSMFRQSSSDYLLQLDADDYLDAFAVQILFDALDKEPSAVMSFGDCLEVSPIGRPLRIRNHRDPSFDVNLLNQFYCYHPRLIRRKHYQAVGGYSDRYSLASDYDLCLRLDELGSLVHVPLPLYFHRIHNQSASMRRFDELNQESLMAVRSAISRRGLQERLQASLDANSGAITLTKVNNTSKPFYIVPEEAS